MSKPASSGSVNLTERVRRALTEPMPSGEIAAILDAAQQAEDAAHKAGRLAETSALDPLLAPADVAQSWSKAEEAGLAARRWAKAVEALRARLIDVREAEKENLREHRFAEAVGLRDAIEADLRDKYPALAGEIADLLARLEAADRAVAAANSDLPGGRSYIVSAESLARGCSPNLTVGITHVTPLVLATRLPVLDGEASALGATLWPSSPGLTASRAA